MTSCGHRQHAFTGSSAQTEALSLFCEREIARKDERRIEMSVGLARFPFVRDLDGFDFASQPSIDKKQIRELTAGRFIANAEL